MSEPHATAPDLIVLHTLRCVGHASLDRLEGLVAPLTDVDVEDVLLALAADGLLVHQRGEFGGWGLTDRGRAVDAVRIAAELDEADARAEVEGVYTAFLALNRPLLDACGDWQLRGDGPGTVLNDHTDEVHDRRVLDRIAAIDRQVQPLCDRLAARLRRFSTYGPRLADALTRARTGELDRVTDDLDAYHSVWFQLHEDLLGTLGRTRDA